MKKLFLRKKIQHVSLIVLALFVLMLLRVSFSYAQTYPPSCVITTPYNNAYFKSNTNVEMHVYASDIGKSTNNGTVTKVEFYNGTTLLGEATTHSNYTYSFTWKCVPAGTYTVKAKATNSRGVSFTSVGVIITVGTNNVTQKGMSACKGKYLANIIPGSAQINYNTYWNGVTAENNCKWGSVEGTRDVFNWNGADACYNHAKNNNLMFRYHACVWASQYPSWLLSLSTADAKAEVVEYLTAIASRFPFSDQIDVLNEQLGTHQPDNQKFRNLFGGGTNVSATDFTWQIWLFEQARALLPNTKLILNDYGLEGDNNAINQQLQLVKALRDRGLIDGFGTQAHWFSVDNRSAATIKSSLDLMATSGVPVYVTELDMNGNLEDNNNEAQQLASYQARFPVFWEHTAVAGVTLWGYITGATWVTGTGLVSSSGTEKSAMTWLKSYMAGKTSVGYPICSTGACANLPTVSLAAPADSAVFLEGSTITLKATASITGGTIANVKFYDGTTLLNTDNTSAYSFDWNNATAGTHTIRAVATDNQGNTVEDQITVFVNVPQGPFNKVIHQIPGLIEAEAYDVGGEGVAYHEADAKGNEGGATLRNDQVDIEVTQDATGNYNVGYILKGEWLEYTVNVAATGNYELCVRVAADGTGKMFHIEMDGANVSGTINVPNTAGWQNWQTVTLSNVKLTAGSHIMRLAFDASYMNLNYVEFKDAVITGMTHVSMSESIIYPNPFSDDGINIQATGDFSFRIIDVRGVVLEEGIGKDRVAFGKNLSKGLYFLMIEHPDHTSLHKIIRQ